jgi:hypothetical protein
MSDEPIDLEAKRREKQEQLNRRVAGLYVCECGSGMFRLWDDGIIECLNCGGALDGLVVGQG